MSVDYYNDPNWREPIILYSGLLPAKKREEFISELINIDILLATLCHISSFENEDNLKLKLLNKSIEIIDTSQYHSIVAKAILSLIELGEANRILKTKKFSTKNLSTRSGNFRLSKKIVRMIFDIGTDNQIEDFILKMTSSKNVFFRAILHVIYKKHLKTKFKEIMEDNLISILKKKRLNKKDLIFSFFFISPKNLKYIEKPLTHYITSLIEGNDIGNTTLKYTNIQNVFFLIKKFSLEKKYPIAYILDYIYQSNKHSAVRGLMYKVVELNDFISLQEILYYHVENKKVNIIKNLLFREVINELLSDDFFEYRIKLIQSLTLSKNKDDNDFGIVLLNLRELEIGEIVKCKVISIHKGLVYLEVTGVLDRVITFYNELSQKVKLNFKKNKGSLTFRGKVANFHRGAYVITRNEIDYTLPNKT